MNEVEAKAIATLLTERLTEALTLPEEDRSTFGVITCNYPPPGGVVSGRDGTLNGLKGSCACKASGIHNGA